jgi:hypothetical protein
MTRLGAMHPRWNGHIDKFRLQQMSYARMPAVMT